MLDVVRLLFLLIAAIIIYTYAGYPLVLFIVGLFRKRRPLDEPDVYPSVALIISAYNEERIIRNKIENSLKLDYPADRLKIVIASDGSVDDTNAIAREYEGRNVLLKPFGSREGKSATLNRAVLGLDEEILIFSDANAFYKEDTVKKLVRNLQRDDVGCVVGHLVYLENSSYVGKGESLYWRYESFLNSLESRLQSVLVATGTIFAIRRELFRPVSSDVANDFQIPANVAAGGHGVVYESEAIAYEQSTYYFREEFSRKRRIIVRGLTGFRNLRHNFGGAFRIFQFVSRKLIRWCIGPMLPLLYISNALLISDRSFYVLFILQNIFYVLAAVGAFLRRGKVKSRLFLVPFYFVMVNAAALAAIATYIGGRRLASWEKAETTRNVQEHQLVVPRLRVIEGKKNLSYAEKRESLENLERIT
jgi:cellulose synthase/poly-beta-1,6-N-acetylglucosamine synthase-like glycosyltransferase